MNKNAAFEIGKMRSLIERIEGKFTPRQAMLNEERLINEMMAEVGPRRQFNSADDLFKKLDSIVPENPDKPGVENRGGKALITMGYVTDAKVKVNMPNKIKRRNLATNRMRTYNDYSELGEGIAGLVCITSYVFNYQHRSYVNFDYGTRFKPQRDALRQRYGLPPVGKKDQDKPKDEAQKVAFGGDYNPQNMSGLLRQTRYFYPVDLDGHVLRGSDGKPLMFREKELEKYLIRMEDKRDAIEGVKALKELGVENEKIDEYIKEFKGLKMKYKNFKAGGILYISAKDKTTNEKFIFTNPNIMYEVSDIAIDPKDFYEIAEDRYKDDIEQFNQMQQ